MKTSFLDNIKNAVENGEFNSEAAKKILEIEQLADEKIKVADMKDLSKSIDQRLKNAGTKIVTEEEAVAANSEYEKKMEKIKKADEENKKKAELANVTSTLEEIESMVIASVEDMFSHINELEDKFNKEFEEKNPIFEKLYVKIEQIKSKYQSIINN